MKNNNLTLEWIPEVNLNYIIEQINKNIFDEKVWIWEKMWKIPEITYSYTSVDKKTWEKLTLNWKNIDVNYTLFCEIWKLDLKNFNSLSDEEKTKKIKDSRKLLEEKIISKIKMIYTYLIDLKKYNWEKEEDRLKSEIIYDSLEEKIKLLEYCILWLDYEIEKAWLKIEENWDNDKKMDKIEKSVFWWKVKDNKKEVNISYNILYNEFCKNKRKLNKQERERFEYFLKKIENISKKWSLEIKEYKKPESKLDKYKNILVEDIKYIPIFNILLEIQWINQKAIQNSEVWSISDWPNFIEFPTSKEYKKLNIARILKLNSHEWEAHGVNEENNKKIIWNIRWAKSTEKEEWLAILMENMLEFWEDIFKLDYLKRKVIDINKCNLWFRLPLTLIWELSSNNEFIEFLELARKLWMLKWDVKTEFFRFKRSNKYGVQHKDVIYTRWFFKVVNIINKNIRNWGAINFENLFLWKFWLKDLEKAKRIIELSNINNLTKPRFNSDRIIYIFETWDTSEEWFINYLEKKYNFVDFSKDKLELYLKQTKSKIIEIVQQIKKT